MPKLIKKLTKTKQNNSLDIETPDIEWSINLVAKYSVRFRSFFFYSIIIGNLFGQVFNRVTYTVNGYHDSINL